MRELKRKGFNVSEDIFTVEKANGKQVVIRTLDIGGDKVLPCPVSYTHLLVGIIKVVLNIIKMRNKRYGG